MNKTKITSPELVRRVLKWFFTLPIEHRYRVIHGEQGVGWGSTRITYRIMTDSTGAQWKVPTHVDGEPCQYLRKHDPKEPQSNETLKTTEVNQTNSFI
jgi:hypothetical protein